MPKNAQQCSDFDRIALPFVVLRHSWLQSAIDLGLVCFKAAATDRHKNGEPDLANTATDQAFVEFERVQKSYDGEVLVVKDLNLSMPKGEFLTMLGPSGSGKTTCLMMLAGFETATHGEIKLGGKPINNIPPHKRGIGMYSRTTPCSRT